MSINYEIDKQDVAYPYNGIVAVKRNELETSSNMDEP